MNDCNQTKNWLMLAADRELDPKQAAWLEGHVKSCAACQAEQTRFQELDWALGGYSAFREQVAPVAAPRRGIQAMVRRSLAIVAALAALFWLGAILIHRPVPQASPAMAIDESFVPIPYVQPLDRYEIATVLQMDVSVAALISVGYKLDMSDPTAVVKADVLVGEDGRAHAVRLVSGSILN
jgi:anti-sigma factor RsiW